MSYEITLDAGTTNTRTYLWENGKRLIAHRRSETGVGCTAVDGNNLRLKQAVKDCIDGLLQDSGLAPGAVECILASGMITSNVGLFEVPHLLAPVGISALAEGMKKVSLPELSSIPFCFIPGMKNRVKEPCADHFEAMDMMRGEEVEALALLESLAGQKSYLFILPGSHTKFVEAREGKLTACLTTLTGELLSVLTRQTILADTVGKQFSSQETYCRDMALLGYRTARKSGLSRAAFAARILAQQAGYSREELASYLLGVVLEQDIRALRQSSAIRVTEETQIIISGKTVFCSALLDLLQAEDGFQQVSVYTAEEELPLSAKGALAVYRYRLNHAARES